MPTDWERALGRVGFGEAMLEQLYRDTQVVHHSEDKVFPERAKVFRAFHDTPFRKTRVVILGEDPYPKKGKADGRAFSISDGFPIDGSLKQIFANLSNDPNVKFTVGDSGDLSAWARQGVLLLNAILTVEPDQNPRVRNRNKRRHHDHWHEFTQHVLRAANRRRQRVVFLLWGDKAVAAFEAAVGTARRRHRVFCAAHPSPRNFKGRKTSRTPFVESRPFSETNRALWMCPVRWTLR